jgi:hypothetical protein
MSINQISLGDPTDPIRPYPKTLEVSAVGDLAFVQIVEVDEGNPTTTTTVIAEMTVSLATLRDALVLICQDRDRESCRPKDKNDEPLPDIAGVRHIVVPI